MSLSDQERIQKIYYSLKRLNAICHEWAKQRKDCWWEDEYDRILALVDQTWHAFLGGQHNGMHWIIGSASSQELTSDGTSPWNVALVPDLNTFCPEKYNKTHYAGDLLKDLPFDPLSMLTIEHFLQKTGNPQLRQVFRVYQELENLSYGLRRYHDDLLEGLKELDQILSKLNGECFSVFSSYQEFTKAYLARQICLMLYKNEFIYMHDDKDVLQQHLFDENEHHDLLKLMKLSGEELADLHLLYLSMQEQIRNKTLDDKRELELRIETYVGLPFTMDYEYQRTKFYKKIEDALGKDFADKMKAIKEQHLLHSDKDKESSDDYRKNKIHDQIWAYTVFPDTVFEKFEDVINPPQPKKATKKKATRKKVSKPKRKAK